MTTLQLARIAITLITVAFALGTLYGWVTYGPPGLRGEGDTWRIIGKVHAALAAMILMTYLSWTVPDV